MNLIFSTFLICYIGEILTERCKEIGNMVYMTNWYQLHDKDILNLIMIIVRSSVEYKMTAGKIMDMSVITFGNVRLYFSILKEIKIIIIYRKYSYDMFIILDNKNCFWIFKYITSNNNVINCTRIEYIKKYV